MTKKTYPIQSSVSPFGFFGGPIENVIDHMLNDLVSDRHRVRDVLEKKIQYPKANIYIEDESKLIFELAIPGLDKENIEITYHENALTFSYKKEEEEEDNSKKYFLTRELKKSSFSRSWKFDDSIVVDENKEIISKLEKGLLTVCIPIQTENKKEPIKLQIE